MFNTKSPIIQEMFKNNQAMENEIASVADLSGAALGNGNFQQMGYMAAQNLYNQSLAMGYGEEPTIEHYTNPITQQQITNQTFMGGDTMGNNMPMGYAQPNQYMANYNVPMGYANQMPTPNNYGMPMGYQQPTQNQMMGQPMQTGPRSVYDQQPMQQNMGHNQNMNQYNMNPQGVYPQTMTPYQMGPSMTTYGNMVNPQFNGMMNPPQQFSGFGMVNNMGAYPQYGMMGMQQPAFNPYMPTDREMNIPGYNPYNNSMMFASDDIVRVESILDKMSEEQEAYQEKFRMAGGFTYYGGYGNFMNPYITAKYQQEQFAIEQEAKQRRIDFNKRLSRLAHGVLGDEVDDEYLDSIYNDRTVVIPASEVQNQYLVDRLSTFTFDQTEYNKMMYNIANNAISEEYKSKISKDGNLVDFLSVAGELYADTIQEEAKAQKRNLYTRYEDVGNYLARNNRARKMYERQAHLDVKGNNINNVVESVENSLEQLRAKQQVPPTKAEPKDTGMRLDPAIFPSLSQSSKIMEDGTLHISAPDWMKESNTNERSYDIDRAIFLDSIMNKQKGV